jgi:hypothetical protein
LGGRGRGSLWGGEGEKFGVLLHLAEKVGFYPTETGLSELGSYVAAYPRTQPGVERRVS